MPYPPANEVQRLRNTYARTVEDVTRPDTAAVTADGASRMSDAAKPDTKKPSNPKDRMGIQKCPVSVIPVAPLWELGLAMLEGALKYGRHNYRAVGVRANVYYDATIRHLTCWWEGEDLDPDSGVHHITKAIASLVVLRDSMIRGNWVDDRPPKSDPKLILEMNARVKALLEKYPEPVEPVTELTHGAPR